MNSQQKLIQEKLNTAHTALFDLQKIAETMDDIPSNDIARIFGPLWSRLELIDLLMDNRVSK